jgi:hypothetical protein
MPQELQSCHTGKGNNKLSEGECSAVCKLSYHIVVQTDSVTRSRVIGAFGEQMDMHRLHWLDYDGVVVAVLMTAIGVLEVLVLGI